MTRTGSAERGARPRGRRGAAALGPGLAVAVASALVGCGQTSECTQLQKILAHRQAALSKVRSAAGVVEKLETRVRDTQSEAAKAKHEVGLDLTIPDLEVALALKAKAIPGATIARGSRAVALDGAGPEVPQVREVTWTVRFREKDLTKAFARVDALLEPPPLVRLASAARDEKTAEWAAEVARLVVEELPIEPKPVPVEPPVDLATVPEEFGTCGAADLRAQIAAVDKEIARAAPQAERASVLLPTAASWEGVRARALRLREAEAENRRLLGALTRAAVDLRLRVKDVSVEGPMVFVEVFGGGAERGRLEKALASAGVAEGMRVAASAPPGVVRVGLHNTVGEARRGAPPSASGKPSETGKPPDSEEVQRDHP